MIITQLHLVLGTIKGHSKMCSFVRQHNATDLLTAGISNRAVARELNVNFENLVVRPTDLTTAEHVHGVV